MRHIRSIGSYEPRIESKYWMRRLEVGNKLWCHEFKKLIVVPGQAREAREPVDKPLPLERVRTCEDCLCEINHCMCQLPFPRKMFAYGRKEMEEDLEQIEDISSNLNKAILAGWVDGFHAIKAQRRIQKMIAKCRAKLLAANLRMQTSTDNKRPFVGRNVRPLEQMPSGAWKPIKGRGHASTD